MQNAKISEFLIPILDVTEHIQEGNDQHIGQETLFHASALELPNYAGGLLTPFHSFYDPFHIKLTRRAQVCLQERREGRRGDKASMPRFSPGCCRLLMELHTSSIRGCRCSHTRTRTKLFGKHGF